MFEFQASSMAEPESTQKKKKKLWINWTYENRDNRPRFSNLWGWTAIRTVHWVFHICQFLRLKWPFWWTVPVNPIGQYGLVQVSKPWWWVSDDSKNFVQGVLFHFEKNSGHFSLFRVFQDVSVNTGWNSRFSRHEVCALKKKMFLKPKQIYILYTKKSQKEKKKWKEKKRNEQRYCTINYKFIWNINKIINYCCLIVLLICLFFIMYWLIKLLIVRIMSQLPIRKFHNHKS